MKKIILFLSLILLVSSVNLLAANADFKVLAVKGDLFLQKRDGKGWDKIKAGSDLFEKDKIKIGKGAYLGLSFSKGGTKELKNEGEYNISDLVHEMASRKGNLTKRFTDYVTTEITNIDDLTKKGSKTGATGAVERGLGDSTTLLSVIKSDFPNKTSLIDPAVKISWDPVPNVANYQVTITDKKGADVLKMTMAEPQIAFNVEDMKLQNNQYYTITIKPATGTTVSPKIGSFSLLPKDKTLLIGKQLKNLKSELGQDESSALGNIIIGKFYEENNLNIEAYSSYKKAVEIVPEVPEYKSIYDTFTQKVEIAK